MIRAFFSTASEGKTAQKKARICKNAKLETVYK